MKKNYFLLFIFILFSAIINAQDFLPFASSNYAGITGIHQQPASIADSRYRFDLALSSTSLGITNNYFSIDPNVLTHPDLLQDLDFNGPSVLRNRDGANKSMILGLRQDVFSFMLSLSPKSSIAFTPSVRSILNIDNLSESLANQLSDLNNENLWGIPRKSDNLNLEMNAWAEFGFTYARVIVDKEKHFLKAGATIKMNKGLGSAYLFTRNLDLTIKNSDTISINTTASYGLSENFDENLTFDFSDKSAFSFDFGFVYEFRPHWAKYKYDKDDKTGLWRRDQDKYLLRIGFTASDIGSVRFKRNPNSKDFTANVQNLDINNTGIESIPDFNHYIDSVFDVNPNTTNSYDMGLPVCFSMQADLRIMNGLYINFTPYLAMNMDAAAANKVHYITAYNIVPRFDKKRLGISVPIQYNAYKQWNVGFGLRAGFFWIGSNDVISLFSSSKFRYGTSASIIFKVPILYKKPKGI